MGIIKKSDIIKTEHIKKQVDFTTGFFSDWNAIFKKHPKKIQDDYLNKLIEKLNMLCLTGNKAALFCSRQNRTFKKIGGIKEDIFRIKLKKEPINLRVIYHVENDKHFVLSCCFVEKDQSDYKKNISKAKARYDNFKKE